MLCSDRMVGSAVVNLTSLAANVTYARRDSTIFWPVILLVAKFAFVTQLERLMGPAPVISSLGSVYARGMLEVSAVTSVFLGTTLLTLRRRKDATTAAVIRLGHTKDWGTVTNSLGHALARSMLLVSHIFLSHRWAIKILPLTSPLRITFNFICVSRA